MLIEMQSMTSECFSKGNENVVCDKMQSSLKSPELIDVTYSEQRILVGWGVVRENFREEVTLGREEKAET